MVISSRIKKPMEAMFFRKPGLPILMVRFPDGRDVPYWNTFYQEVTYRTVDAQDLMQAAGLQYTESVMLAEVLNTQTKEGKKPAEILAADENAEVTRFMSDEEKKKVVDYMEAGRRYTWPDGLKYQIPARMGVLRQYLKDTRRIWS